MTVEFWANVSGKTPARELSGGARALHECIPSNWQPGNWTIGDQDWSRWAL